MQMVNKVLLCDFLWARFSTTKEMMCLFCIVFLVGCGTARWDEYAVRIEKRSNQVYRMGSNSHLRVESVDMPEIESILVMGQFWESTSWLPFLRYGHRYFVAVIRTDDAGEKACAAQEIQYSFIPPVTVFIPKNQLIVEDNMRLAKAGLEANPNKRWRAAPNSLLVWREEIDLHAPKAILASVKGWVKAPDSKGSFLATANAAHSSCLCVYPIIEIDSRVRLDLSDIEALEDSPWMSQGGIEVFSSMGQLVIVARVGRMIDFYLVSPTSDQPTSPTLYHSIDLDSLGRRNLYATSLSQDGQFALLQNYGFFKENYYLYDVSTGSLHRIGSTSRPVDFIHFKESQRQAAKLIALEVFKRLIHDSPSPIQ